MRHPAARACWLLLLAWPRLASASPRAALIEAVVTRDASDVSGYPPALVPVLGGALAGAELAVAVDARLGAAPGRLPAGVVAELAARVKQCERNLFFTGVRVRESIEELEDARSRLGAADWTLAHDPAARQLYARTLLKLARAYQVAHLPDGARLAEARLQELVRAFRGEPLDPEHNERELYELYRRVRAALPASVMVQVPLPAGARAFVQGEPLAGARERLPPGDYRLFVEGARGPSRVHRLRLDGEGSRASTEPAAPGGLEGSRASTAPAVPGGLEGSRPSLSPSAQGGLEAQVALDLDFEAALRSEPFVGFVYAGEDERAAREALYVQRLGRALGLTRVYVLAAGVVDGRPCVGLWAYRVDGERARLVAAVATPGAAGAVTRAELGRVAARLAHDLASGEGDVGRGDGVAGGARGSGEGGERGEGGDRDGSRRSARLVLLAPASMDERVQAGVSVGGDGRAGEHGGGLRVAGWALLGLALPAALVGSQAWARGSIDARGAAAATAVSLGLGVVGSEWALLHTPPRRRLRTASLLAASWGLAAVGDGAWLLALPPNDGNKAAAATCLGLGAAHLVVAGVLALVDARRR